MNIFAKKPQDEDGEIGEGLELDLEIRICPTCHRELLSWETVCPGDGVLGVPRATQSTTSLPPPPAHLLDPEDADDPDAGSG